MKKYTFSKVGYSRVSTGWTGDFYSLLIIKDDEYRNFTVRVGYEDIYPISEYLKEQGCEPIYQSNQVYGQIHLREYKNFTFDTLEDVKEWIEK